MPRRNKATAATVPPPPPDQAERDRILHELDRNMLVEAAAGTGKTTSMVGRMAALLGAGKCEIDHLAAVTFTRKAAAELRGRFQVALEQAAAEATGKTRERLAAAVGHMERCFIGTIHSFCGRLLRERPVEAGVDVAFEEMDDEVDLRMRRQAWAEYVTTAVTRDDPIVDELDELGLELGDLADTFERFAEFPDVDEWPAPRVALPDLTEPAAELRKFAEHMLEVTSAADWPPDYTGNDKLIPKYEMMPRMVRQADLERPADLMEILEQFRKIEMGKPIVQRDWPGNQEQAQRELDRWNDFTSRFAIPLVECWREHRYEPVLRAMRPAVATYDRLRHAAGQLNYQDLLMKAATLLSDKLHIREYFRRRFTHLLVDEFQDTDPIQAQVMLLLTADDPRESNWWRCRPVPGSLFVVGDPKQSIYRFRRADIVTYNRVRQIIESSGGVVVNLSANFRTRPPLIEWLNTTFNGCFPAAANPQSPAFVALQTGRRDDTAGELAGLHALEIPATCTNKQSIGEFESDFIARYVRRAIDDRCSVPRSPRELARGIPPHVQPEDFLIITRNRTRMGVYALALQALRIPHQVTGGSALNEVDELALLHACLRAVVEPDNALALVATLRSTLFGVSDRGLYTFRRAGGRFSFRSDVPAELLPQDTAAIADAFERLRRYATWLAKYPPVAAIEKIAVDLGLPALAAADDGGDVRAGSLAKSLELLRAAQIGQWTAADLVAYLGQLVDVSAKEKHDGMSARPPAPAVRIMNLHKAKGLEAPIVFLADPNGEFDHAVTLHINRSGDRVFGYVAVYGPQKGRGAPPLLAQPAGWTQRAADEQEFQEAEKQRLLYVAATRAGTMMAIALRAKGDKWNPWQTFADPLRHAPRLADPGPHQAPEPTDAIAEHELVEAQAAISARWTAALTETYSAVTAKAISVTPGKFTGASEHGTEWGSVIHVLLEAAMRDPAADLHRLAAAALAEQDLDPALAGEAVATVVSVQASQIWQRARAAAQRLTEVPFQITSLTISPDGPPTLVRGVIDLVFRDDGGWVVVDYKTDSDAARRHAELVEHYRGQLRTYAEAWQSATGLPVAEFGLYFVSSGEYVRCN